MENKEQKIRGRFTGGWKKEGPYGVFYKGRFTKSYLLEQLAKFPDNIEDFDVYISKLGNKAKDTDPDMIVTFEPHVEFDKK